jgi:hypothetical protein
VADDLRPCPRAHLHTPAPTGYLAWHEWAEAMFSTFEQQACPGCRQASVWTPTMPTCALPPYEHACVAIRGMVI